jgi:hypothetical protein
MKKLLLPLAAILLLAFAVPAAFADAELGVGLTPGQISGNNDPNAEPITSFHVGWTWTILYLSWDALAMPSYWMSNATGYVDSYGNPVPGFLNLFDAGIKLTLQPFIAYAEVGTNMLYLKGGTIYNGFGVNARLGAGLRFGWWGADVSLTQAFANWSDLEYAVKQAVAGNTGVLVGGMVPTLNFTIYF